jgi:hypothetical protein
MEAVTMLVSINWLMEAGPLEYALRLIDKKQKIHEPNSKSILEFGIASLAMPHADISTPTTIVDPDYCCHRIQAHLTSSLLDPSVGSLLHGRSRAGAPPCRHWTLSPSEEERVRREERW